MASEENTPIIPSWIKASLFEKILKDNVDGYRQTTSFKVYPALKPGENYSSLMIRIEAEVELQDNSSKTITFMLKAFEDIEQIRELVKVYNVFDVETIMYEEVIPELEKLYKEAGTEIKFGAKSYELCTNETYILLEDLRATGFKNINRLEGLDIDHTKAVLTKLAQWHAASAVRVTRKGPYKSTVRTGFFREECREFMKVMFESTDNSFIKCAKSYDGHELYYDRLYEKKDDRLNELMEDNKEDPKEFNVLNHGDCWSNNIMFQYDDSGKIKETYFVDYQIPRWGSPAHDLYYFLLSSTKYEIKLKQFDYFIKCYHDKLIDSLKLLNYSKEIPTLRDIHIALHKHNPWALYTATGVMSVVLLDPNDNASMDNFLADTDVGAEFKNEMFFNPRYRKHMEMILPWLFNRGAL